MRWLLDSNILIDYLNGVDAAAEVLARSEAACISRISWIEVRVGAQSGDELKLLRSWLRRFEILEMDEIVADRSIAVRQRYRLRLPDALILASAQVHDLILVSRNTRDFPRGESGIQVPYEI